jgi:simple sugar transport system permease protein
MKNQSPLARRDYSGYSGFLSSLIAIVMGLLVGFIVLALSNPAQALNGIRTLVSGGFTGGAKGIGNVLYYATPIIMAGLGVGMAFQAKMFNIGGSGQFIVGAYCSLLVSIRCDFPGHLVWIIPLLAGMAGGALWALLPGILRAFLNVNIVIATIMMNYIGMYAVNYLVKNTIYDQMKNQSRVLPQGHTLPAAGLDALFPNSMANIGILIAAAMAILVYIVMNKTIFGFELKACGSNSHASRYAGINEKRNVVLAMLISGALIGLGGALMHLSAAGKYIKVVDVLSPEGFNGIPVALLASNHPIGIIFSGIFIAYMQVSGFYMQTYRFSPEITNVVVAVIIYFSAFALIIKEKLNEWLFRPGRAGKEDER